MKPGTLVISLDLGGSGVRGIAFRWPDGKVVPVAGAARNLRSMTDPEIAETVRTLVGTCRQAGLEGPAHWVIGAAGARPDKDSQRVAAIFHEAAIGFVGVDVFPDMLGNWAAGLGGEDGIVTVNGTGSILFGRHAGREERRSGWGYLLDELPSGAAFGRFVLMGVLAAWEGHREPAVLAEVFRERAADWPQDRAGVVDRLYKSAAQQQLLGTLSPVFAAAVDAGCGWCCERLETSLRRWSDELRTLADSLGSTKNLSLSGIGGLWTHWPSFAGHAQAMLTERAPQRLSWRPPAFSSVWGPLIRYFVVSPEEDPSWRKSLVERARSCA